MTRTVLRSTVRVIVVMAWVLPLSVALAVSSGQLRTTTLLTGSMSPGLPAGAFLLERPVDADDVRSGDVITFEDPYSGALVTHRVVTTTRDERGRVLATTRGDANDGADEWQVVLSGGPVWTVRWHVDGVSAVTTAVRNHHDVLSVAGVVLPVLLLGVVLRALWRREDAPVDENTSVLAELVDAGAAG